MNKAPLDSIGLFKRPLLPLLLLFAASALLYLKSVGFEFIPSWDDGEYVIDNVYIRGFGAENMRRIFLEPFFANYAPLHLLSYSVDYALWGLDPRGYHLTSVLLHALNSALVFVALRRLTKNGFVAFVASALFAVHPVNVENVAWISERKSLLAALLCLASLSSYLAYREDGRPWAYPLSLALFAAALLSKANAVMLPAALLAYELFLSPRRRLVPLALPFAMSGLLALVTILVHSGGGSMEKGMLNAGDLLGTVYPTMVPVFWKYVWIAAMPVNLSGFYDTTLRHSFLDPVVLASALAWLAAFALAMWKGSALVRFSFLWFWIWLLPVSNILPIPVFYADRYMYLPAIGLFVLFGCALAWAASFVPARGVRGAAAAAVALLAALTFMRLDVWRNDVVFWEDTARKSPMQDRVHLNLGYAYEMSNRFDEAEREYVEAIRLYPTPEAVENLRMLRLKKEFMKRPPSLPQAGSKGEAGP